LNNDSRHLNNTGKWRTANSITDNLSSGVIFSVDDIAGLPFLEVDVDGDVRFIEYGRYVGIGTGVPSYELDVFGTGRFSSGVIFLFGIRQTIAYTGQSGNVYTDGSGLTLDVSEFNVYGGTGQFVEYRVGDLVFFTNEIRVTGDSDSLWLRPSGQGAIVFSNATNTGYNLGINSVSAQIEGNNTTHRAFADYSTIIGGRRLEIKSSAEYATAIGGHQLDIQNAASYSTCIRANFSDTQDQYATLLGPSIDQPGLYSVNVVGSNSDVTTTETDNSVIAGTQGDLITSHGASAINSYKSQLVNVDDGLMLSTTKSTGIGYTFGGGLHFLISGSGNNIRAEVGRAPSIIGGHENTISGRAISYSNQEGAMIVGGQYNRVTQSGNNCTIVASSGAEGRLYGENIISCNGFFQNTGDAQKSTLFYENFVAKTGVSKKYLVLNDYYNTGTAYSRSELAILPSEYNCSWNFNLSISFCSYNSDPDFNERYFTPRSADSGIHGAYFVKGNITSNGSSISLVTGVPEKYFDDNLSGLNVYVEAHTGMNALMVATSGLQGLISVWASASLEVIYCGG